MENVQQNLLRKLDVGKPNGSNGTNGDGRAMTRKMSQVHYTPLLFDKLEYITGWLGETIAIQVHYILDDTDSNLGIGERRRSGLSQCNSRFIRICSHFGYEMASPIKADSRTKIRDP